MAAMLAVATVLAAGLTVLPNSVQVAQAQDDEESGDDLGELSRLALLLGEEEYEGSEDEYEGSEDESEEALPGMALLQEEESEEELDN